MFGILLFPFRTWKILLPNLGMWEYSLKAMNLRQSFVCNNLVNEGNFETQGGVQVGELYRSQTKL